MMNKINAKVISDTISNEEILSMINNAQKGINDWTKRSRVNKGMTLGTSWNILAYNFDVKANHMSNYKINLIWEFGDFLPKYFKINKENKVELNLPYHEVPKFK